jgi:hypothetical protein
LREVAPGLKTVKIRLEVLGMKYNQHTLDKIEKIAEENGYVIRYERGTFQSGYCILQARKVIVINKFFQTEGRINTLVDLMPQLEINFDALTLESQKMYDEVMSAEANK